MRQKRYVVLIMLLVLLAVFGGLVWHMLHYTMIDFRFYPKDATSLDLRGKEISMAHYKKICRRLPVEEVLWDIPVQDKYYPMDATEVTVTGLTRDDLDAMDFLAGLETVDAVGCTDYDLLLELQERRPEVEVLYTVHINGRDYPQDSTSLDLTDITDEEMDYLGLLPKLTSVNVGGSENVDQLKRLQKWCHEEGISFRVTFGDRNFSDDLTEVVITGITEEEVGQLQYMTELKSIRLIDPAVKVDSLVALRAAYSNAEVVWETKIAGLTFTSNDKEIDISSAVAVETVATAAGTTGTAGATTQTGTTGATTRTGTAGATTQTGTTGAATRTGTAGATTQTGTAGTTARTGTTGTTVSGGSAAAQTAVVPKFDLEEVASAMEYFPDAEKLFLGECGIDNETLAAFRESKREDYKVVWVVQCGEKLKVRTDDTTFMPTRERVYYFFDDEAYNLRYCEDMVCIDVGHMAITNIDWVAYMPHLKYLILAHTQVQNIEPIRNCKELIFLELDYSPVRDFSPLVGCTALEDLNIGLTYADVTPIASMTWLKNVWFVGRGGAAGILGALTNATRYCQGEITVGGGWRSKQNYYDMRDMLGMPYMR